MTATYLTRDERLALKAATREAVRRAGGLEALAAALPVAKSTAGEWININTTRSVPLEWVIELSRHVESLDLLRAAARLLGCDLVVMDAAAPVPPAELARIVLGLGARLGAVQATLADAERDGVIEPHELSEIRDRLADLASAVRGCMDRVQHLGIERRGQK